TLTLAIDHNLVVNSGFERPSASGKSPLGWVLKNGTWDMETTRSGFYSGRVNPDSANTSNVIYSDKITVQTGDTYLFSAWVKNSSTAGLVTLGFRHVDATGGSIKYDWH